MDERSELRDWRVAWIVRKNNGQENGWMVFCRALPLADGGMCGHGVSERECSPAGAFSPSSMVCRDALGFLLFPFQTTRDERDSIVHFWIFDGSGVGHAFRGDSQLRI
ncbi:MAG: hypothetical protein IJR99_14040 [Kiritimatiellae bacterium]|nr:hypothetical protein [Kiritimatiellia bacterium]